MVTIIAIGLLALAIIINTISIWHVSRSEENSSSFISSSPLSEHTSYETKSRINKLEQTIEEAQPFIDKYKKERKQNHWKQYNDWKKNNDYDGKCAECHGQDFELDTNYKYTFQGDWCWEPSKEYPKSAEYKCKTCGEVVSQWEYKED
ncbi:hypothetical protein [Staphylococcus kloosii]|uniref:Uncharacterized protein n=1 Tax=Staphylococcus kloosii TaxID=29384 RepID=A0ABQ0XME6_9STAP|nr:hypothetical protein [Staphylococcus kloosii]AVQ35786.1 hypothetical protein C7J89_06465 [Staphylococcus kloosii]PNZ05440.1 hypothetical protein CD136_07230 [Staphylococcus kloosii]GEP82550.1 hypothetical protein SKL01_17280 [Staphylococcus kloosii]SUM48853.1 Uncharacterised protein [Staphylococcus kloosii]